MASAATPPRTPPTSEEPDNLLTIAFLKCDKLPDSARQLHGTYEDVLHNLFEPMLPSRMSLETKMYDAVERRLPSDSELDQIDAIVISGSFEDDAHSDEVWVLRLAGFLIGVADNYPRIRIIGICFGLQVLARAFGPSKIISNDKGWEVGSTKVNLTPLGSQLVWGETPDEGKDFIMTQQIHSDIAASLPTDFELLASSDLTPIQGMAKLYDEEAGDDAPGFNHSHDHMLPEEPWRRVHIIAFQGHPEWHEEILLPLIDEHEADGAFSSDFAKSARERAKLPHDGEALGRALLKVLGVAER